MKFDLKNVPAFCRKHEALFFWLTAALLLFVLLGRNPLWGSEDRWAEIARQMLLTNDWFHPAINGTVYFDKPLLSYWLIAAAAKLLGFLDEAVVRLPSAFAALAALWATRDLGKRLCGEKAAALSGWLLLSSYAFLFWGRSAAAELANLAAVILAVDWFYCRREKRNFISYFVFFLICFAGALTKGIPALVLPIPVSLLMLILEKSWVRHLNFSMFSALIVGAALYLASFWLASKLPLAPGYTAQANGLSGLELVWKENILRVFQPFDHNDEGFYCYLIHVPRIMLPWTLFLPAALWLDLRSWKTLPLNRRFLWLASALIFLLFSASGSRRWYYILPIMPFLAVLMGAALAENGKIVQKLNVFYRWLFLIAGVLALSGTAAFFIGVRCRVPLLLQIQSVPAGFFIALFCAAAMVIVLLLRPCGAERLLVAGTVIVGVVFSFLLPLAGGALRTEKPFMQSIRNMLPEASARDFLCVPDCSGKLAFYLDFPAVLPTAQDPEAVRRKLREPMPPAYLILTDRPRDLEPMKKAFPEIDWTRPLLSEAVIPLFESKKARKLHLWKLPERK